MNDARTIAIANGKLSERESLRLSLADAGHQVVFEESDLAGLAARLKEKQLSPSPDLSLVTLPSIGGCNLELLDVLRLSESPLVAIVDCDEEITPAIRELPTLMGVLVRPVESSAALVAVEIALRQVQRVRDVQRRLDEAERSLAERKVIERAKGLLMLQAKISEDEAFSRMRQAARSSRRSIAAVAQDILVTHQLMKGAAG